MLVRPTNDLRREKPQKKNTNVKEKARNKQRNEKYVLEIGYAWNKKREKTMIR